MNNTQDDGVDHYKRAMKQIESNDLDGAVESLTLAISRNGEIAWYHHSLGEILERQRNWSGALHAYSRALQLNPVSSKYRQAIARVSTRQVSASAREIELPRRSGVDPTKPRLLVVEDSEVTRSWYDRVLRAEYQLTFASTARAAIRSLVTVRPSLVLLDWQLDEDESPGGSEDGEPTTGLDVCAHIKRSAYRSIPVLMLTSKKGLFNKTRGKLAKADRFLTKPVPAPLLIDTIKELLAEARQSDLEAAGKRHL